MRLLAVGQLDRGLKSAGAVLQGLDNVMHGGGGGGVARALAYFFQSFDASAGPRPVASGERKQPVSVTLRRTTSLGSPARARAAAPLPDYLQLDSLQNEPGQAAFVTAMYHELQKVNAFFLKRVSELQTELRFLESQLEQALPNRVRTHILHPDSLMLLMHFLYSLSQSLRLCAPIGREFGLSLTA